MVNRWNLRFIYTIPFLFFVFICFKVEAHLCDDSEKVYFSCQLKESSSKVSLCGDVSGSFVQFRQNLPGKIKLVYPVQKSNSSKKFKTKTITDRSGSQVHLLTFQKGLHAYEIFAKENSDVDYQGIVIKRAPHMEFLNKFICENEGLVRLKQIPALAL